MKLLARLDAYGTDDPDFNEGQREDRCPLCELPVIDHPGRTLPGEPPTAKWPHRWAAFTSILSGGR